MKPWGVEIWETPRKTPMRGLWTPMCSNDWKYHTAFLSQFKSPTEILIAIWYEHLTFQLSRAWRRYVLSVAPIKMWILNFTVIKFFIRGLYYGRINLIFSSFQQLFLKNFFTKTYKRIVLIKKENFQNEVSVWVDDFNSGNNNRAGGGLPRKIFRFELR